MSKLRWAGLAIIIAVAVVLLGWTIYAYSVEGAHSSVSAWLYWLGYYPIVPFVLGFLAGHVWPVFGRRPREDKEPF